MTITSNFITFSIVSHGQLNLVKNLLSDLVSSRPPDSIIIVTLNIPECEGPIADYLDEVVVIRNDFAKGFGSNHNAAFRSCSSRFFCILNPDIRFSNIDWSVLFNIFDAGSVGACAPLVCSPSGGIEDSARIFPNFFTLFNRFFFKRHRLDYLLVKEPSTVDWLAGMFVVYEGNLFKTVNGFDEGYFMYLEDADICMRLLAIEGRSVVVPSVKVIHDARRSSKKKLNHLVWHLQSAFRFLFKRYLKNFS
jgi:N-acetylglucosaminyl-diphospho-decaprenol L-rhamnosyltransferase